MASKYTTGERYLFRYFRRVWQWDPERKKARKRAEVDKAGKYIKCEGCNIIYPRKRVDVDHVDSVAKDKLTRRSNGNLDWNTFYDRMFIPATQLKNLCKDTCHKAKTKADGKLRASNRKKNKE